MILSLIQTSSGNSVIWTLSEDGTEREIVAGWYATEDGHTTSVAHWLEEDDFRKNGGVMNHETVETMSSVRNHSR